MARLYIHEDEEDENDENKDDEEEEDLPDLADVLSRVKLEPSTLKSTSTPAETKTKTNPTSQEDQTVRRASIEFHRLNGISTGGNEPERSRILQASSASQLNTNMNMKRNSGWGRSQDEIASLKYDLGKNDELLLSIADSQIRRSPRRAVKRPINYNYELRGKLLDIKKSESSESSDGSNLSDDSDTDTDLSGFIVDDDDLVVSDSDISSDASNVEIADVQVVARPTSPKLNRGPSTRRRLYRMKDLNDRKDMAKQREFDEFVTNARDPYPDPASESGSESERDSSIKLLPSMLSFSPPRKYSPVKRESPVRPETPPLSPSRGVLASPRKRNIIPVTPHRPSIDAYWDQDVMDEWNEQHSPQKSPETKATKNGRRRLFELSDEKVNGRSTTSPERCPLDSPSKEAAGAARQRKIFNKNKHSLAVSFLAQLDTQITQGRMAQETASTGGIRLVWSKKLLSTAGRASWRQEVKRMEDDGSSSVKTASKIHFAEIELAEKVIDDELRLLNVIAHEFCHLANFIVSGVRDQPHGKQFKVWASKCSKAFADRGVEVTTKHSYQIAYKYIWQCRNLDCLVEYKRHSKSIDPAKHSCGKCKSKLVQVKPAPRPTVNGPGNSSYQKFVKNEFDRVKRDNPGKSWGKLMAILGQEFRELKGQKLSSEEKKESQDRAAPFERDHGEDPSGNSQGSSATLAEDFERLVLKI